MLVLTRKQGEQITIDHGITITVGQIRGKTVRIGIDAPRDLRIARSEIDERQADLAARLRRVFNAEGKR